MQWRAGRMMNSMGTDAGQQGVRWEELMYGCKVRGTMLAVASDASPGEVTTKRAAVRKATTTFRH